MDFNVISTSKLGTSVKERISPHVKVDGVEVITKDFYRVVKGKSFHKHTFIQVVLFNSTCNPKTLVCIFYLALEAIRLKCLTNILIFW